MISLLIALIAPLALEAAAPAAPAPEAAAVPVGEPWRQVRIEERVVIRVAPQAPARGAAEQAEAASPPRLSERKVGKCLPLAGIAGVRMGGGERLLLFMRDRRLIGADLEKACRARDFYSGFYVERSRDGQLCVERDMLQARSGASCAISRLRQLVEADE